MPTLADAIKRSHRIDTQKPWPRFDVTKDTWTSATSELAADNATLVSEWCDGDAVHIAVRLQRSTEITVLSLAVESQRYPSVGRSHAPALRLERAIHDLYGIRADGNADQRPWLDHGRWGSQFPLAENVPIPCPYPPYPFLRAEGAPMHQIPVGPVHAGIIEPGHFRFSANGETIVRLEERLGYVHKGINGLMLDAPLERALRIAGRLSGDSTVAYAWAFCRALEAALDINIPARASFLRALMAELERIANHLGDIGAICNDAAFSLMHAHCGALRENVLRVANVAFGHRLMMDCIIPGGVTADISAAAPKALATLIADVRKQFPSLVELYDNTTSLQDRTVGTGVLSKELAFQYGCGGYVGRASGRAFDARQMAPNAPYDLLNFEVPVRDAGDVDARVWIRIEEITHSINLIEQILARLPAGGFVDLPSDALMGSGEGISLVEGFRGDIFASLRVKDGRIQNCHLRDPSWFQWPLLEAAIEGNIVADFPLCNKSFNCSYSGHDL
jgi:Ni,Fe-hydrogenase III large subunit/Ni,Fe-hydrogenase III component G